MLEHFRQTDSLAGVLFQHLFQQCLQSQACAVPHLSCEGELRVLRVFDYFILAIGVKWQLSADQRVDEAPKAPDIALGPIRLLSDHLWRDVSERAKWLICCLFRSEQLAQPKVNKFDLQGTGGRVIRGENIFQLHISVNYASFVQILEALADLPGDQFDVIFFRFELLIAQK